MGLSRREVMTEEDRERGIENQIEEHRCNSPPLSLYRKVRYIYGIIHIFHNTVIQISNNMRQAPELP